MISSKDIVESILEAKNGTIQIIFIAGEVREARTIITRVLKKMRHKYTYFRKGEHENADPLIIVDNVEDKDYDKIKNAIDAEANKSGWDRLGYDIYYSE